MRHAKISNESDRRVVEKSMAESGANAYIITTAGVDLTAISPGASGQTLPQRELIALADDQCDKFILGQTLTSGVSADGGSRALGEVHQGTLDGVVDGVADFVGGVLTHQLIPAIVAVNYGESLGEQLPEMWAKREEVKDEKALAERDEKIGITTGKVPVSKAWFYERHGIPVPAETDDLLVEEPEEEDLTMQAGDDDWLDESVNIPDDAYPEEGGPSTNVEAADASTVNDSLTVDQLSTAVLEGLTGVSREWLSPVRPFFDRLAALAMSKQVTDEDFLAALEKAQAQLPEIFDLMDTQALESAFMDAISSAALAGSVSRYE